MKLCRVLLLLTPLACVLAEVLHGSITPRHVELAPRVLSENESYLEKRGRKVTKIDGISLASKSLGLYSVKATHCGSSGATRKYPNGSQRFLNCGISKHNKKSGWKAPKGVTAHNVAYVSLAQAYAKNSVWKPCKKYNKYFQKYGKKYGLPPILLAAFALQESTCNAHESGDNGGAIGLMQITRDKCGKRSKKECAEVDYNVKTAAKYFKQVLDDADGNFLLALGQYNGWYKGLSYSAATAAAKSGCCECQNNLDYLFQMLNGWLLGRTGYNMGTYRNLDRCE